MTLLSRFLRVAAFTAFITLGFIAVMACIGFIGMGYNPIFFGALALFIFVALVTSICLMTGGDAR